MQLQIVKQEFQLMKEEFVYYFEVVDKYEQNLHNMKRNRFKQEQFPSETLTVIVNLLKYKMEKLLNVYNDLFMICQQEVSKEKQSSLTNNMVHLNILSEFSQLFEELNFQMASLKKRIKNLKNKLFGGNRNINQNISLEQSNYSGSENNNQHYFQEIQNVIHNMNSH